MSRISGSSVQKRCFHPSIFERFGQADFFNRIGQKQSFERVYKMHEDSVGTHKPFWELVEGERAQLAISLQGLHPRNGW